ncbi:MAG: M48 family metallopeptidase [Clostridia bacterium]|nr:M48 family metallopeptidase [Clostridia bacterium]
MIQYTLIRSDRKTVGMQIKDGQVIVRAPRRLSKAAIDAFVQEHQEWAEKHLAASKAAQGLPKLTEQELRMLAEKAVQIIPARVAHYAALLGVTYGRITIRAQKTKWGSCSAAGNLNFNCLLLLAPSEVLDSVVVHELCHRKHMNHSKAFYAEITRVMPDYHTRHAWLKKNGAVLMARAHGS